jgi:hypothetical protein
MLASTRPDPALAVGALSGAARAIGLGAARLAGALRAWVWPAPEGQGVSPEVRLHGSGVRERATGRQGLVIDLLERRGSLPLDALVRRLSQALYREALGDGGGAADVGIFGPALFSVDARREVEAGDGCLWTIVPGSR